MSLIREHILALSEKEILMSIKTLEELSFYKGHVAAVEIIDKIIESIENVD